MGEGRVREMEGRRRVGRMRYIWTIGGKRMVRRDGMGEGRVRRNDGGEGGIGKDGREGRVRRDGRRKEILWGKSGKDQSINQWKEHMLCNNFCSLLPPHYLSNPGGNPPGPYLEKNDWGGGGGRGRTRIAWLKSTTRGRVWEGDVPSPAQSA